ncbi:MAG: hypothetical protein ACLFWM_05660 [Actinomycetota bacterium]
MTDAAQIHPGERLEDSRAKIRPPFELDPTLCLYSPQANRDALAHPRVAEWLEFVAEEWDPGPTEGRRVALLIPCTKYKPYSTSREHRAINHALLADGWVPQGQSDAPAELGAVLDEGESPQLLHNGPLRKGEVVLDRIVMSEPLALVPYQHIYHWRGNPSVATAYDDPGLFESRGTSVSPERPDSTAVPVGGGRWRWGANEREAYVEVHNRLADVIARALGRVGHRYSAIGAWVSPGLTHRSFLAGRDFRKEDGLAMSRRGPEGSLPLRGVLDVLPGEVTIMPTGDQLDQARGELARRLEAEGRAHSEQAVRAVYARGDGNDTPLGLPETLRHLVAWLNGR